MIDDKINPVYCLLGPVDLTRGKIINGMSHFPATMTLKSLMN